MSKPWTISGRGEIILYYICFNAFINYFLIHTQYQKLFEALYKTQLWFRSFVVNRWVSACTTIVHAYDVGKVWRVVRFRCHRPGDVECLSFWSRRCLSPMSTSSTWWSRLITVRFTGNLFFLLPVARAASNGLQWSLSCYSQFLNCEAINFLIWNDFAFLWRA